MLQRWVAARHETVFKRQTEEERAQVLEEWELRKVRAEAESVRTFEAARFTSLVHRRVDPFEPPTREKVADISAVASATPLPSRNLEQENVRLFRKLNAHILGPQPPAPQRTFTSLSPYFALRGDAPAAKDRGEESMALQNISRLWQEKHPTSSWSREDASVLSFENMRMKQLEEVNAAQRALGTRCSLATLQNALVMPARHMKPGVGSSVFVPNLMPNPFYDPDAGKKKKKGKKKRSKSAKR